VRHFFHSHFLYFRCKKNQAAGKIKARMQKKEPIKVNCESRALSALNKCRVAARRGQQEESPAAAALKISQVDARTSS
jgi:hypothetical protein